MAQAAAQRKLAAEKNKAKAEARSKAFKARMALGKIAKVKLAAEKAKKKALKVVKVVKAPAAAPGLKLAVKVGVKSKIGRVVKKKYKFFYETQTKKNELHKIILAG